MEISQRDARRIALESQGLLRGQAFGRGKRGALKAITQLGYVQIDTISVVERAHHHVLGTRVPNYAPRMLDDMLARDRTIFEYWSHAAAFLPMEDYRFYLPMKEGWRRRNAPDRKLAREIIARVRAEGPLQSRDFEAPPGRKSNGWWDWKPAKLALELLFLGGELMITSRDGFQKRYDLPERVLPSDVDTTMPSEAEWLEFIVTRIAGSHGIVTEEDIAFARTTLRKFYGRPLRKDLGQTADRLVEQGKLQAVTMNGRHWYAHADALERLPLRLGKRQVSVLSPFDNIIINRRRLADLFDFEYLLECYVPAPKRVYGYFTLPVLWGDEIVARIDAKAHRRKRELEIKALFLEPGVKQTSEFTAALESGLDTFAAMNGCDHFVLKRTVAA
ncbi:MAG: YcaQ family DNA glycosylase [Pseudomonadales bacterium]|nr:YcaQ family DNA glycosylase [Pseudomonadales bacterium]